MVRIDLEAILDLARLFVASFATCYCHHAYYLRSGVDIVAMLEERRYGRHGRTSYVAHRHHAIISFDRASWHQIQIEAGINFTVI